MWNRSDCEDGYDSYKTGSSASVSPGWGPGLESSWHSKPPGPGNSRRRNSTVSDSGDTGIGTYCSDSVEDDSSSSTTPSSFQPLSQHLSGQGDGAGGGGGRPVVHVLPSPSKSHYSALRMPASPSSTVRWSRSCQMLTPTATSQSGAPSSLDLKDHQPIRKWSSLSKLSSGADQSSTRASVQYNPESQGSLDRGLLYGYRKEPRSLNTDLYLPLSSSLRGHSVLQRSPGAAPCYWSKHSRATGLDTDLSLCSALSSPIKHSSLDMNFGVSPETKLAVGGGRPFSPFGVPKLADSPLGRQTDRDSPIQPAVRTQMWLTEQMEYSAKGEHGGEHGPTAGGGNGLMAWQGHQQDAGLNQMLLGSSHTVNPLVKVKEGLLRQRELEIDRQKQQILQLHARIRENELRAQLVLQSQRGWFEDPPIPNTKDSTMETYRQTSDRLCCDEELGRKLAVAELEVLHLNEFIKQATHKYTEDVRKLEEKIKTRDRYISSLKKKCQRESEQNQEKQQRIETLEKYLADLPTLDEVQVQALQLEEVRQNVRDLERTVSQLQKSLQEGSALMTEKDVKIETQAKREKELMACVHSLQQKVQQCLEDGVRLPVLGLKQLEVENKELLEQQDHSSRLIEHQREQIDRLTLQLTATSARLQMRRGLPQQEVPPSPSRFDPQVEIPELGRLLKEMSLCLLDLQGLCSILVQRAQGKELNMSLLLGMKSLNVAAEDSDVVEEELKFKLLEVGQLRRDIDELRKSVSDCYAHYVSDSCVSQ